MPNETTGRHHGYDLLLGFGVANGSPQPIPLRAGDIVVRDPLSAPEWLIFSRATVVETDADWAIIRFDEGGGSKVATMHLLLKERPDVES